MHLFYVDPKETEMTARRKRPILSRYLSQVEKSIYGSGFRSPTEGYAQFLDVDSFIDQFWMVELSKNIDGFRYSCYMFKDRGGKLRVEPIWDWNLSFGNANYHQGWMPENWYWPLLRETEVCWYQALEQRSGLHPTRDRSLGGVAAHTSLRRKPSSRGSMNCQSNWVKPRCRNFQRWPILGQSVNPNFYVGESYAEEVNWMKNWIQERIAWIDSQFLSVPVLSSKERSSGSGLKVSTPSSLRVTFTTRWTDLIPGCQEAIFPHRLSNTVSPGPFAKGKVVCASPGR